MIRVGPDARAHLEAVRGELDGDARLSWLLRQRVTVPERTPGYMDRPWLVQRALPTRHRLTAIVAPGGFGKTTLLAECCRRLVERGIVTAWLSIDVDDGPEVLDSYLAFALRYAGLAWSDVHFDASGVESASSSRIGRLLRVLEARDEPFVLALDDLQRLSDPGSVALLELLVRRRPPNLHLAVACRRLPAALDIGGPILSGTAAALTASDLKFTSQEIAKFFGMRLSRRALASLKQDSAGWPMALRIHRNQARGPSPPDEREVRDIVGNWVESRLWEGMESDDRELLLDAGLFEWMDAELLEEVLGAADAMRRLESMDALAGLLNPVRGTGRDSWRLHPLIQEHCARRRLREDRRRYLSLHRRIAVALARRGETLPALRHAAQSGDAKLAGEMLEEAGGVRLWIRYGLAAFQTAIGLLDEDVLHSTPRLQLARCVSLLFSGTASPKPARRTASCRNRARRRAAADRQIRSGWTTASSMASSTTTGAAPWARKGTRTQVADLGTIAASPATDGLVRGFVEHSLCVVHTTMGEFEAAEERAERALASLGGNAFARMLVGFQRGQGAMAQGRVEAARASYTNAMRIAKARFLDDPASIAIASVLLAELELERHRRPPEPQPGTVPRALTRNGTPLQAYAAASGAAVGRALARGDGSAMATLQGMLDFVERAGLPALVRYLSAMRVSLLADEGLAGDAERCWREAGLPEETAPCLELNTQSWREMEAIACARLRLLMAKERFAEARAFAEALCAATEARGLRRTHMRALVLAVVLEDRAGDAARQRRHLEAFLALFAETDYAWSAVCERSVCLPAVERLLADAGDSPFREPAEALLAAMRGAGAAPDLELSEREREVLSRLEARSDKAIASELDLTPGGVRYHLRKLFSRLGATSRGEVVRRARELGLLQEGGSESASDAAGTKAREAERAG